MVVVSQGWWSIMFAILPTIRRIFRAPAIVALVPAIAVIVDYSLTFFFSSGPSMILQWEASPLVKYAVAHNIVPVYLAAIVLFYYGAAYAVLKILWQTRYYPVGVFLVVFIGIIHVLGGLSWIIRNPWYSNGVVVLSLVSILLALTVFGYSLLHQETATV